MEDLELIVSVGTSTLNWMRRLSKSLTFPQGWLPDPAACSANAQPPSQQYWIIRLANNLGAQRTNAELDSTRRWLEQTRVKAASHPSSTSDSQRHALCQVGSRCAAVSVPQTARQQCPRSGEARGERSRPGRSDGRRAGAGRAGTGGWKGHQTSAGTRAPTSDKRNGRLQGRDHLAVV